MTAANVITAARELLYDTVATYRWSDTNLLIYVDAGQRRVRALRPDLFLVNGAMSEPSTPATIGDSLVLGYNQQLTLARYVAAVALQEDNGDTVNMAKGKAFMDEFHGDLGFGLGRA